MVRVLKNNFDEATKELNVVGKNLVRGILAVIIVASISLLIEVAINGAPPIYF